MGTFTTTDETPYRATRVLLRLQDWRGSIELCMEPDIVSSSGLVLVRETRPRFTGTNLLCTADGRRLVIEEAQPTTGKISVRHTGSITSSGGGYANTGIDLGGGAKKLEPREYARFVGPEPIVLRRVPSSKSRLVVVVGTGGVEYALV